MSRDPFDALVALATRHGLPSPPSLPVPWTGATSAVYPWGDVVIKVPHERVDAVQSLVTDAAMNGFLRSHRVRVPPLRVLDEGRDIFTVPVAIYDRVAGARPLPGDARDATARDAWFATGQQLACIHAIPYGTTVPVALREFRQTAEVDPRAWLETLAGRDVLTAADAGWLGRLLDRLAPVALADETLALSHGDVNAANVLVDERTGAFRSLIDLAGMGWLDPVWDFVAIPFAVVPWVLAGHRAMAPLPADESAERRICWCQVQTRLHTAWANPDDTAARAQLLRDLAQVRGYVERLAWEAG